MRRSSIWWDGLGQPFAMLALLCQMFSVVLAGPDMFAARILSDASVICHSDTGPAPAHDHAPTHRRADCPLCPFCAVAALTGLASAPPMVPAPRRQSLAVRLPQVREGPAVPTIRTTAQPRGPPAPV